ncbi:N-acetyltransferase [Ralstonia solanacearum species complex bacterium KE056]|uniref:GNAT family N-acetyltransferase n=1 Tax=Ralstonia solanacearum species complex bacterium KE056 TaxID=3119585 RepID=UPI002FC3B163
MQVFEDETVFRPASLWDIPSIYRLAQLGSVAGVYADTYLDGVGHVLLLKQLFVAYLSVWFSSAHIGRGLSPLSVLEHHGEFVGFAWVQQAIGSGTLHVNIAMLSIAPDYFGMGCGRALLNNIVQRLPKGAVLQAECTRYADRMKALLRRSGFVRRRQSLVRPNLLGLDVYEKTVE